MCNKIKPEELVNITVSAYIAMDDNGHWYAHESKPILKKENGEPCGVYE